MDIQKPSPAKQAASFPYVYGSLSFLMGKKSSESLNTHKWICYVRGVNNQDLSYLFKKVVFYLHSSFQNPVRGKKQFSLEIYQPPYEIQQLGWGEFQIMIQLHFNHPSMPPIQIPHMLRLHHSHQGGGQVSKKPLCSQVYDEVVFMQMDEHLKKIIQKKAEMQDKAITTQQPQEENDFAIVDQPLKSITQYARLLTNIDPEDHRNKLEEALRFIKGEISSLQDRMRTADIDTQKVYEELYGKLN